MCSRMRSSGRLSRLGPLTARPGTGRPGAGRPRPRTRAACWRRTGRCRRGGGRPRARSTSAAEPLHLAARRARAPRGPAGASVSARRGRPLTARSTLAGALPGQVRRRSAALATSPQASAGSARTTPAPGAAPNGRSPARDTGSSASGGTQAPWYRRRAPPAAARSGRRRPTAAAPGSRRTGLVDAGRATAPPIVARNVPGSSAVPWLAEPAPARAGR